MRGRCLSRRTDSAGSTTCRALEVPGPELKGSGQAAHLNGVVRIGVSITQGSKMGWAISGSTWTTSSLEACPTIWARHGSTTPTTSRAWSDHRITGSPSLRHLLFGVFVGLTAGLPEQTAHYHQHSHSGRGAFHEEPRRRDSLDRRRDVLEGCGERWTAGRLVPGLPSGL